MIRSAVLVALVLTAAVVAKKSPDGEKPSWAKKDINSYSEADMERLLDQWEVGFIIIIVFDYNLDKCILIPRYLINTNHVTIYSELYIHVLVFYIINIYFFKFLIICSTLRKTKSLWNLMSYLNT